MIQHATPAGIPAIYLEPAVAATRRLVIWLPGFTDDKESAAPYLRELAAAGFVALSFDPVDHGARSHRTNRAITDAGSGQFVAETDGKLYGHCPAFTFQCRAEDSVVPAAGAQRFAAALAPVYAHTPERLEVVLDPGSGHELTPAMRRNSLAWFRRFLTVDA